MQVGDQAAQSKTKAMDSRPSAYLESVGGFSGSGQLTVRLGYWEWWVWWVSGGKPTAVALVARKTAVFILVDATLGRCCDFVDLTIDGLHVRAEWAWSASAAWGWGLLLH